MVATSDRNSKLGSTYAIDTYFCRMVPHQRMMEVGERMNQAFINRRKDSNGTSCPQ